MSRLLKLALEAADGKVVKEAEHTIYGRLVDHSQLKKASSMEHHEQWEVRIEKTEEIAGSGSMRVRKIQVGDSEPTYEFTTKVKTKEDNLKLECSVLTTADNFMQFQFLSGKGMIKDRFHFPIIGTELVWEVDMYLKEDGTYHDWCKIDLETDDLNAPLPELPIEFSDVILPEGMGEDTPEERNKKLDILYEKVFLSKNVFLKKVSEKQSENS